MGRKHANFTGLSRFVQEAFGKEEQAAETNQPSASTSGITRKASELQDADAESSGHPSKKRKIGLLGAGYEKYDATGLAPYYTEASQVPEKLRKYFFQRERYFSRYSEGCLLDEEGWYSVTPELVADQIAERCRCDTILDAFCGVGGNTIAFAKTCERVIALDTSPVRLALARHNAIIYGVEDRIEFILADYLSFARSYLTLPNSQHRKIDAVFLSPPWGGPEYLSGNPLSSEDNNDSEESLADPKHPEYSLSSIKPIHGAELFKLSRQITPNIAYFLPRNTNLEEISQLIPSEDKAKSKGKGKTKQKGGIEMVEVEEEWMGSKLKALTCYFGGLVAGQEHLWDS